jgi:hypothetical protein
MDQTGPALRYLAEKFPGISAAKMKEGVFIGPQIRKLFRDEQFDHILSGNEKRAWNYFRLLATKEIIRLTTIRNLLKTCCCPMRN